MDGEVSPENSGWSVSLNSDGTILAIGAIGNDGNGNDLVMCVYMNTSNSRSFGPAGWNRLGSDIDGEYASDISGYSVSLNSDGTYCCYWSIPK